MASAPFAATLQDNGVLQLTTTTPAAQANALAASACAPCYASVVTRGLAAFAIGQTSWWPQPDISGCNGPDYR